LRIRCAGRPGAKLGYAPVYAVDHDPVAIETTVANAAANGVNVHASVADAHADDLPEVDTTVANLTLEDVRRLLWRARSSRLVTSGYLATDSLQLNSHTSARRATLDGWAADVWTPGEE
jgi:ribosomal protein L11 methylase PrmA